eukprot:6348234-Lingulodinium_polyedra.AAC.3
MAWKGHVCFCCCWHCIPHDPDGVKTARVLFSLLAFRAKCQTIQTTRTVQAVQTSQRRNACVVFIAGKTIQTIIVWIVWLKSRTPLQYTMAKHLSLRTWDLCTGARSNAPNTPYGANSDTWLVLGVLRVRKQISTYMERA